MQGLCFTAMAEKQSTRQLQLYLSKQDKFIDTVIQGDKVRVVMQQGIILEKMAGIHFDAVNSRLEDAFITLLKLRYQSTAQAVAESTQTHSIPSSTDDIIQVDHVDRWFGEFQAVKALSFTVKRGEIFGLLGANGAGKTTTFRMLCGLLPVSNGQLSVAGIDLRTAAAKARARIGYMSQNFSLYRHLSVLQNLIFFSSAYGLRNARQRQRVQWALQFYELEPYSNTNSGDLPLGYKQRLAMACALMHEPEILFLDEPTSGVDPLARREFWMRTNQLAAAGVTVLVTTHFMEEAEYCDRLVIMVEGDILTTGTPAEIKQQVRSKSQPEPTMEDAFIHLITQQAQQ
jgi:ABC-2 type transport system ATP-binding protein